MALILTTITEIVPTTIGAIWATATIIVAVAAHRATIKAARDECFRCDKPGHWAHDTATLTWTPGPLQALLVPTSPFNNNALTQEAHTVTRLHGILLSIARVLKHDKTASVNLKRPFYLSIGRCEELHRQLIPWFNNTLISVQAGQ